MRFERFAAARYFRSRRSGSRFSAVIQWITVGGIALGSGGLLLAFSLTSGFSQVIREKLFEFGAHIRVETFGDYPIYRADTVAALVRTLEGVAHAEPVAETQAMIQSGGRVEGFMLKGISGTSAFPYLEAYASAGTPSVDSAGGRPGIVLGAALARSLEADTGRIVTVFALQHGRDEQAYAVRQFRVTGIFHTGIDELDGLQAFVRLDHAQYLSGIGSQASDYIEIRLLPNVNIWEMDGRLNDGRLFPFHTVTVFDYYSNIFAWVLLQEKTIPVVISALVLIAAFELIGTVLMMVLERAADIGIMRTFGAAPAQILRIFVLEGLFLGLAGLAGGFAFASGLILVENRFHFISLPEENYYMSTVSFSTEPWQVATVAVITLLLCAAAAWIPARHASKIEPVSTIQFGR